MTAMAFGNQGNAISPDAPDDRLALIDFGTAVERHFTYGELRKATGAIARALLARGLRRGDRVAILSLNRAEFLFSFLGAMQAGLVAVPVNYKLPADTVRYIIDDCDARIALCDGARLSLVPETLPRLCFDDGFEAFLDQGPFVPAQMQPEEPAMFLYTSGSSGRPKGVVLSHYSHIWVMTVRARRPGPVGQRALVAAPLYHMNALGTCQVTFAQGDAIVLLPQFVAADYIAAIGRCQVNLLTSVPTMIAMMLRERELLARTDLSSVRAVRMGSAPVTQSLVEQLRQVFPSVQITNGYGTTEIGPVVFGPHPDGISQPELSVGYPHHAVQLRLMRDSAEVEDEGVLEVKCGALMTHYHKLPQITARVMTTDGYYRTGDVFRRDVNGFFFFVGREDDMFVCGGENIYPNDVERMLERHPGIHQAAVVPVPDELKGHKPIAFIVRANGVSLEEEAVKAYALANAPAYQHPRRVIFIDEMPLAGTNKIDKRALATYLLSGPAT
jgi:long-chain acyl-CoA synthetase